MAAGAPDATQLETGQAEAGDLSTTDREAETQPGDPFSIKRDPLEPLSADMEQRVFAFQAKLKTAAIENHSFMKAVEGDESVRDPLSGMEARVAQLRASLDKGEVDPRSAAGQRFAAALKASPQLMEEYQQLKSPGQTAQMKRDFRLRWARQDFSASHTQKFMFFYFFLFSC